ncbi:MAG: hypothetical protein AMXMBFR77_28060 [Phycisphaerales bacterium]
MELGIKVKFASKLQPDRIRGLLPMALAGAAIAAALEHRIFDAGKAASGGAFGRMGSYLQWYPPGFANLLGAPVGDAGTFLSARDAYGASLHGDPNYRFETSGGMRRGLSVSVTGAERVVVGFRGSSQGYGDERKRARNTDKAAVAQSHTTHQIMEPSEEEVQTLIDFLAEQLEERAISNASFRGRFSRGVHGVPAMVRVLRSARP